MNMPAIGILLNWRNQVNKSVLYLIHIRISINNTHRYYKIDTPNKIRLDQWSGKEDSRVKSTHEFALEINYRIIEKKNIINNLIKRSYSSNKEVTFEILFQHLKKRGEVYSFYDFMDSYIKKPPVVLQENTLKKYKTALSYLKAFKSELTFPEIDNLLVLDFSKFMQNELKLESAARKKYLDVVKMVIKHARKENYIDPIQVGF